MKLYLFNQLRSRSLFSFRYETLFPNLKSPNQNIGPTAPLRMKLYCEATANLIDVPLDIVFRNWRAKDVTITDDLNSIKAGLPDVS